MLAQVSRIAAAIASRSGVRDGSAKLSLAAAHGEHQHGRRSAGEKQRPQSALHRSLVQQNEIQPEGHPGADCQPGDFAGESVGANIFVGRRLPADQNHRDHGQHHTHRRRLAGSFAQCHADRNGHCSIEYRGQRRDHRDRTGTDGRIEPVDADRLADPVERTPQQRARVDGTAGRHGHHTQHHGGDRIGHQHDAERSRPPGSYTADEITDAVADRGQLGVRGADQLMPLARRPNSRRTSRCASRRAMS